MNTIRILIVDDHTLVRAGIRTLLENLQGMQVVGEASNGRDALRQIKKCRPDVVLMDIAMKGLNGLEAAARATKEFPHVRVIILSMHANEEYVIQSLRCGAAGYLLKDAAPTELEFAIKAVARGETYLTPAVSKHVIADYVRRVSGAAQDRSPLTPFDQLTSRQREVLQLIAEGYSTRQIAETLHVSIKTVETHRMQLMDRLDIHDVAGLVRYALRMGLVTGDE